MRREHRRRGRRRDQQADRAHQRGSYEPLPGHQLRGEARLGAHRAGEGEVAVHEHRRPTSAVVHPLHVGDRR
ncbi:hypothetical protein ACFPRL_27305 [Pseudoclavibacter helvolus]